RSVIYSTGLPPILIESVLQAVERVEQADAEREKVAALSNEFREGLQKLGLDCGMSSTQIVPLILGDEERTLRWSRILLEKGVFAVAIRPPTVPRGAARLRFSITAAHDPIAIRQTLRKIEECFNAEQAS
ncbi:MAG: aminotransferase class I/II-fold pyridoxal phosphate-dependent enzyme, partial [Lentisphaerae bacterium]